MHHFLFLFFSYIYLFTFSPMCFVDSFHLHALQRRSITSEPIKKVLPAYAQNTFYTLFFAIWMLRYVILTSWFFCFFFNENTKHHWIQWNTHYLYFAEYKSWTARTTACNTETGPHLSSWIRTNLFIKLFIGTFTS